jgi:S-adenosylmethionine synthetase
MRPPLVLERVGELTVGERPFEIVERKGVGHPDFICDAVMEESARRLSAVYLQQFGALQHFNLDKGLLAAGRATPAFGGGTVDEPMRLIFGDRAIYERGGKRLPVGEILEAAARSWLGAHLRHVDPTRHIVFQNEVRPGSAALISLFGDGAVRANDTSVAVGFAPLSETERLVLETEQFLNGAALKARFPESGEDVKVMGVRRGRALELTVALAFVDRFVLRERDYFEAKAELHRVLEDHLRSSLVALDEVSLALNTLDRPGSGLAGVYLTVTGTSAEGGDSGQVGRGNRLSGLFSSTRPVSNEAASGKNPICHVGKVYNALAQQAASRAAAIAGIREATVYLASRIGAPLPEPHLAAVQLVLAAGASLSEVKDPVEAAVGDALAGAESYVQEWLRGEPAPLMAREVRR